MIHLYRVAGLRADEGIGPCDDAGVFPSAGAATSRPRSIIFILLEKMGEFVKNYDFAHLSCETRGVHRAGGL